MAGRIIEIRIPHEVLRLRTVDRFAHHDLRPRGRRKRTSEHEFLILLDDPKPRSKCNVAAVFQVDSISKRNKPPVRQKLRLLRNSKVHLCVRKLKSRGRVADGRAVVADLEIAAADVLGFEREGLALQPRPHARLQNADRHHLRSLALGKPGRD